MRNAEFAIGLQTLNTKTCGGKLVNEEGTTGGRTTATAEEFGSSLQAFCVNQARDRVMTVWTQYKNVPVKALPGFRLEGSALALFGAAPDAALAAIGAIEVAEGLPHPVIDGEWIKTSGVTGRPYLIAAFSERTIDAMLEYTKRLGFPALYHSGPFKTWGHFDLLEDLFPNGRAGFRRCVEKARAMGLRLGAHTLTNFITTNDPFVTTAGQRGLMAAGIAVLQKDDRRGGHGDRRRPRGLFQAGVDPQQRSHRQRDRPLSGRHGDGALHADELRPGGLRDRGRAPCERGGRQEAHGPSLQDALPRLAHAGGAHPEPGRVLQRDRGRPDGFRRP